MWGASIRFSRASAYTGMPRAVSASTYAGNSVRAASSTQQSLSLIHIFETIQGELALTRDEVADVLGSVYRKLGVGDKQEALDFIHSVSE